MNKQVEVRSLMNSHNLKFLCKNYGCSFIQNVFEDVILYGVREMRYDYHYYYYYCYNVVQSRNSWIPWDYNYYQTCPGRTQVYNGVFQARFRLVWPCCTGMYHTIHVSVTHIQVSVYLSTNVDQISTPSLAIFKFMNLLHLHFPWFKIDVAKGGQRHLHATHLAKSCT